MLGDLNYIVTYIHIFIYIYIYYEDARVIMLFRPGA